MATSHASKSDIKEVLGANERLVRKLHPHPYSFFRYYGVGISLIAWSIVLYWLFFHGPLSDFEKDGWLGDRLTPMLPMLLWLLGAVIVGAGLVRRFHKAFRVVYWLAVVIGLVLGGLLTFLWTAEGSTLTSLSIAYGLLIALMSILAAEMYRQAFNYYITNLRIVIRYKLFSSHESNLRFEKIEDWKISRPLAWRILGIGSIRPYVGTEDVKDDPDRGYDAPDECLFGIKDPEGVKRQLVDLVLERDQIPYAARAPRSEPKPAEAKREPRPAPEAPAQPSQAKPSPYSEDEIRPYQPATDAPPAMAGQATSPQVAYYQPSDAAQPVRNYERVEAPREYGEAEYEMHAPEAPARPPPPEERVDPAAGAYEPPAPEKPRTMYPQAEEPGAEPRLEDKRTMSFQRSSREAPPRKKKPVVEDKDQEVYDASKPRSL